jgi:hypothetical protein
MGDSTAITISALSRWPTVSQTVSFFPRLGQNAAVCLAKSLLLFRAASGGGKRSSDLGDDRWQRSFPPRANRPQWRDRFRAFRRDRRGKSASSLRLARRISPPVRERACAPAEMGCGAQSEMTTRFRQVKDPENLSGGFDRRRRSLRQSCASEGRLPPPPTPASLSNQRFPVTTML